MSAVRVDGDHVRIGLLLDDDRSDTLLRFCAIWGQDPLDVIHRAIDKFIKLEEE